MNNQQYIKVGRRYEPVGYSDGNWTPAPGIWLVTENGTGCKASERILKIGELPELFPYANLALDKRELSAVISGARIMSDNSSTAIAEAVLKWIATKGAHA